MKKAYLASFLALCMVVFSGAAFADQLIDSFENSSNPAAWQSVSPEPQTWNVTPDCSGVTFTYGTAHVTQGAQSMTLTIPWTVPGGATSSNPYVSADGTTFWGVRINIAVPASLNSVPNNGKLKIDFYNNTADTIKVAACLRDSAGSGGLERGPFKSLNPNSATTYEWNLSDSVADPVTGFVTGDGKLDGTTSLLRGIFVYTATQPTQASCAIDMDNVRQETAQTDFSAPAIPVLYSVKQGSGTGKLLVSWKANTETDLAGYYIYVAKNQNFGVPIMNRFGWPATPTVTAAKTATSVEISDVTTTEPVYVRITAFDNATPSLNESLSPPPLGAFLKADGTQPSTRIIMDLDRWSGSDTNFAVEGYAHMIAYDGQALQAAGVRFDSISAKAIDNGAATLSPTAGGFAMWVCAEDGPTSSAHAGSDAVLSALTTYANAGGKLFATGRGLGRGLKVNGSTTQQTFYTNILKADCTVQGAAGGQIDTAGSPFATVATFYTTADTFNLAAGSSTDNEGLSAVGGSTAGMAYNPAGAGTPAIYYNNSLVYFGFGFEQIRDINTTGSGFTAAAACRASVMQDVVTYLSAASPTPTPYVAGANSTWEMYR